MIEKQCIVLLPLLALYTTVDASLTAGVFEKKHRLTFISRYHWTAKTMTGVRQFKRMVGSPKAEWTSVQARSLIDCYRAKGRVEKKNSNFLLGAQLLTG